MKRWHLAIVYAVLFVTVWETAADERIWNGGGVNALASNPTNWVGAIAPVEGDSIVLDATTNKNMTWDMNIPVQSWTQVGYTGTVTVDTIYGPGGFTNLVIWGDCVISNGVWTQTENPNVNYESNRLCVTIGGNLIVGTNAAIDVTGKGYAKQKGPGYKSESGSYGGGGEKGGPCYGSIVAPVNLGSGGAGNAGGGAILLAVSGGVRLDGLLCADGRDFVTSNDRVGSGGSIYLTAGSLTGMGTIRANGGNYISGASGGGGRVALVVTNNGADFAEFIGAVCAFGGPRPTWTGAAGTVYKRTATQGLQEGLLIIDNNGKSMTSATTEITSNMTDKAVRDVIIRNKAYVTVLANQTLTVSGIWSNGGSFAGQAGGSVIFAGGPGSTSTLYGSTTFMNLVSTNAGKTLVFAAGSTNGVAAGGNLILRGAADATNLFLRSSNPGQSWKFNVNVLATQTVWNVDVQDSDARPGADVLALFSLDSGRNSNWTFSVNLPGGTNVWTGAFNTLWSKNGNWSMSHAPVEFESIRIPAGTPTNPVMDGQSRIMAGLEIEEGASLSLNGFNLTVTNDARVAGSLICAGTETLTFRKAAVFSGAVTAKGTETVVLEGDADFTGCAFAPAASTLVLGGSEAQTVNPASRTFYKIRVEPGPGLVFTDGFSAYRLSTEPSAAETCSLTFAPGKTSTVERLTLLSAPGTTNILLQSASSGQTWGLNVSSNHSIRGVDVADCDASTGRPLYPSGSRDGGNNKNWNFSMAWAEWAGLTGNGMFEDAANWQPSSIPGPESWVRVDTVRPMTIASSVSLARLLVGGSSNAASTIVNGALTVIDQVEVFDNGTLYWNRPGVISNDVFIRPGGTLTHTANDSSESNKLTLTVLGDLVVEQAAAIDVTGKGYAAGKGPGKPQGGSAPWACGSHGGVGCENASGSCYGSIVAPTNLGSGGASSPGGGAIRLTVAGALWNDGLLCADGGPVSRTGSGGSLWITAAALNGGTGGVIRANGGGRTTATDGGGGGGRVALIVTNASADFTVFQGAISAYGGRKADNNYPGAAGTVYLQRAGDRPGRGTVSVNNDNYTAYNSIGTEVPPDLPGYIPGEASHAAFMITNAAILRLTNNFTVGDIWLQKSTVKLDLRFNTLTVNTREHTLLPGSVLNEGAIVWRGMSPGALIMMK